jgi:hypothetical protein
MLVFITHPRYFSPSLLPREGVELIYIFNSPFLFKKLSGKYRALNLDPTGKVTHHNLKPTPPTFTPELERRLTEIKFATLNYFNLKLLCPTRDFKKDRFSKKLARDNTSMVYNYARQLPYLQRLQLAEKRIEEGVVEVIRYHHPKLSLDNPHLLALINYGRNFFHAYLQMVGLDLRFEPLISVYKWNWIAKVGSYYLFTKWDLYENRFHFNYLKVLARLFIETIHKVGLKQIIIEGLEGRGNPTQLPPEEEV